MKNNKIYIITFGCSLNFSDSEVMAGLLKESGFKIVKAFEQDEGINKSDLVIINSCTVKDTTEIKFKRLLKNLQSKNKKIIIAGCISQTDPEKLEKYSLLGTTQLNNVVKIVKETLGGNIIKLLDRSKINPRLNLPKIRKNPLVEIIPISQGCLGNCSYCKTKAARFDLVSYDKNSIICQAKDAIKDGVKELWITSQDTAVYGKDLGITLVDLLGDLVKLKGNFKIRLGMGNPNNLAEIADDLIPIFMSRKMFKFLHIPVQSGNDIVLKKMNRKYSILEYKKLIKKLRSKIKNLTLSTDIIVGFPTETEKQFFDSIKLIKEIKPDVVNMSRYSARSKTLAANMPQIHGRDIKTRSRLLTKVFYDVAVNQHKKWLGWKGNIVINETGKVGTGTMVGRNSSYKPVIIRNKIKNKRVKIGDVLKVKITKTTRNDLRGEIIN
jgi:threonylcarbamoyladenosine tRNA methylthiotransferase CDKAL1